MPVVMTGLRRERSTGRIAAKQNRKSSKVKQLSPEQNQLVSSLTNRLTNIPGIRAVVLGGSHARGRAHSASDIDLGLLYSEAAPFSIQSIRELAEAVNDTASPLVTDFYQWALGLTAGPG
jgi:predicted nucleotidyltransferase